MAKGIRNVAGFASCQPLVSSVRGDSRRDRRGWPSVGSRRFISARVVGVVCRVVGQSRCAWVPVHALVRIFGFSLSGLANPVTTLLYGQPRATRDGPHGCTLRSGNSRLDHLCCVTSNSVGAEVGSGGWLTTG